jgi:hypothetical protein
VLFVSENTVTRTSNNAYSLNPVNIAGETVHNWNQFTESRRSFPTQVTVTQRILLDTGASLAISDLPNAFLWQFWAKGAGLTRSRGSIDPPDFHQGEN